MKNRFVILLVISMIALGAICGIVFYFMFMSSEGLLIFHCILVGMFFGLLDSAIALYFIKKYTTIKTDNERLEQQLRIDKLTQLYNRYAFDSDIKGQLYSEKCSMIFIDIDNFRSFNNDFGHHAGDKVLVRCAQLIKNCIRSSDRIYRYGGEEIVIILDGCPKTEAEKIGVTIVETIHNYDNTPYSNITVSAGVAAIPDDAKDIDHLIKVSDAALITAKKKGKNRVVKS